MIIKWFSGYSCIIASIVIVILIQNLTYAQNSDSNPQVKKFRELYLAANYDSLLSATQEELARASKFDDEERMSWSLYYKALAENRISFQSFGESTVSFIKLTQASESVFLKAEAYKLRADFFSRTSKRDSSIEYLLKAMSIIERESYFEKDSMLSLKYGQYRHNLAGQYYSGQNYDAALETVMANKDYAVQIENKDLEIRSYQIISAIYSALGSYATETNSELNVEWYLAKSKEYAQLFIKGTNELNNPYLTGFGYLMVGNIFSNEEKHDSAAHYFTKSLEYVNKEQQPVIYASRLQGIANSFNQMGDYEKASNVYQEALIIAEEVNNKRMQAGIANNLSFNFMKMGRLNEAKNFADLTIKLGFELKRWGTVSQGYGNLSGIEKRARNFEQALVAYESHIQYRDSLLKQENLARIEDIETKYETEKKESEIELLSQQNELQASQIKVRNTQFVLGGLFFVIILLAGYIAYKRAIIIKEKEIQEAQQRLLSVQMNPHFLFNALIAIQHFVMKNEDSRSVSMFVAKFAKVTRLVLNYSRKQLITLTDEVRLLEEFLRLQQIRVGNKFEYSLRVDGDVNTDEVLIPPMLTQPFIENAVEHAILPMEKGGGKIQVRFIIKSDMVEVIVEDNGEGFDYEDGEKEYESLSTAITTERFDLLEKITGKPFAYRIKNKESHSGLRVEFSIPLLKVNVFEQSPKLVHSKVA